MATILRGDDNFDTAIAQKALVQTYSITASSQALTADTTANMTGLSATITPSTTSKRIKVSVRWAGEFSVDSHNCVFGIKRGSTAVGNPAAVGLRNVGITTPMIGFYSMYHNQTKDSTTNNSTRERLTSSITLEEVD